VPRWYTLTHSDRTGDLFLTVGPEADSRQISGLYTRLMRDEVLAEWRESGSTPELHVHCHVSGGPVLGSASWRYQIFQRHLRQVIQAFRHGDRELFASRPHLDQAAVYVHFHARQAEFRQVQDWGVLADYGLAGQTQ
jgi:hypothetical protein